MTARRRGAARSAIVRMMVLLVALGHGPASEGQEPSAEKPRDSKSKWAALFQRHAKDYLITGGVDTTREARMVAEPILRWWQPVRATDDGAVFLWLRDGRPEAVGSIFTIKENEGERALIHEFHSFSPLPVRARWRGGEAWECLGPGLETSPFPDAPPPRDSAPARLRQMQDLAREFTANSVDRKGSRWELRLLSKPLYRYEAPSPPTLDGALFAFAQGTDPEVLLLIEATQLSETPKWHYALASFTDLELHARLAGREVFHTGLAVQLEGRSGPHVGFTLEKRRSDDPDDFDKR